MNSGYKECEEEQCDGDECGDNAVFLCEIHPGVAKMGKMMWNGRRTRMERRAGEAGGEE